MRTLVWFKNDLRVSDHPALAAARDQGQVVACYCMSAVQWRRHDMGDWRLAFQLRTLEALRAQLQRLHIELFIVDAPEFADVPAALIDLSARLQVDAVASIDEYPLNERRRDDAVEQALRKAGLQVSRHVGDVVVEPGVLKTGIGDPYTVFTPFYKKWLSRAEHAVEQLTRVPGPAPKFELPAADRKNKVLDNKTVPAEVDGVDRSLGESLWPAGEEVAQQLLDTFITTRAKRYPDDRDVPSLPGTSGLSAHLAVGSISARQCVAAAMRASLHVPQAADGLQKWISEIAWRDFYRHIVAQFDHVSKGAAFRREKDRLPWRHAPDELQAWQEGLTGYPLVDAAMRQLNETGWMHNRLRMIAAMFLTKHLLIDWRAGEKYFMQKLVDGDFASNNGGWQWSASTGTDAAPYFRIFNPTSQGSKFDRGGAFTTQYIPELRGLDAKYMFEPHKAGVTSYPAPMVDHKSARERALAFFKANL
ncbi:MAG: cryptochrome/photolyase family protein [bacterium]